MDTHVDLNERLPIQQPSDDAEERTRLSAPVSPDADVVVVECESGEANDTGTEEMIEQNRRKFYLPPLISKIFGYDHESFVFATRVATSMMLASLFTLVFSPNKPYPYPEWVVTSAGIVSWLSYLDTASAVQKALERTVGTIVGAGVGLVLGFLSVPARHDAKLQASILGIALTVLTFVVPYVSNRVGWRNSYAARLGIVTLAIVALPFYGQNNPDCQGDVHAIWYGGAFRAANILIGCGIALFSLVIWPQSTKSLIIGKVNQQMLQAGDSAAKVLDLAYDSFVNKRVPTHWSFFLLHDRGHEQGVAADQAYLSYTQGMSSWKSCYDLFEMLPYDPFFRVASKKEREHFEEHMAMRSKRAFNIQMNLAVLDGIVRAGVLYEAYESDVAVLKDIGQEIKLILDVSADVIKQEEAVKKLVEVDLVHIRVLLRRIRNQPHEREFSLEPLRRSLASFDGESRPLQLLEGGEQMALFFNLLEHLIIRASRLFYLCREP